MIVITCPKCGAETKLSLVDSSYEGPRKCWKCREILKIKIENDVLVSCDPMSQEEFDEYQEAEELKKRLKNWEK
jgi:hypothetical protein